MSLKQVSFNTSVLNHLALLFVTFCLAVPAWAEGSRELIASTGGQGFRPFLEFNKTTKINSIDVGIMQKATIKVFVNVGEEVNLGSSVYNAVDYLTGAATPTNDIAYRSPLGTQNSSCDVDKTTGFGFIGTLAKEQAGPKTTTNPSGYLPCKFTATETGVYEIDFHAPNDLKNSTNTKVTAQFPTDPLAVSPTPKQGTGVSAWDVTIFKGGVEQKGRAYANYLPLHMGAAGKLLYSKVYILTSHGFLYRINLNGMEPWIFTFFANNRGFTDNNGNSLFKSVPLIGSVFHSPANADTANHLTHKIFFNPPAADLPLSAYIPKNDDLPAMSGTNTWLLATPKLPVVKDFTFVGKEGTAGQAGVFPLGGDFSFWTDTKAGTFMFMIDVNNNSIYGDGHDRQITGSSVIGTNTISWDGLDGLGNPVPPLVNPPYTYGAKLSLMIDDVHFPFLDIENNPTGLIVQRLNRTTLAVEDSNVYYNDSDPKLNSGTPPNPITALQGINSSAGAQSFTGNFGNNVALDTWTSLVNPVNLDGGISIKQADLSVTKSHSPVNPIPGATITYTITVRNDGPSNATGITVQDTLPNEVGGTTASWTCSVTSPNVCAQPNGTGDINTTVNLTGGTSAIFTLTGTVNATLAIGAKVANSATITRPNDVTNPQGTTGDVKSESTTDTFTIVEVPPLNYPPQVTDYKDSATPNDTTLHLASKAVLATDPNDNPSDSTKYDLTKGLKDYTVKTIPSANQGVLYLGDPATGLPILPERTLTPADLGNLYFKPNTNFSGNATFTYLATDKKGASSTNTADNTKSTATVTIPVTAGNQPPVATDKTTAAILNTATLPLPPDTLAATDTDGTIASYTITDLPNGGEGDLYQGNPASGGTKITAGPVVDKNNLYFKPNSNFTGNFIFTYTATDNQAAGSNTATVSIPVMQAPVAIDKDANSTPNDKSVKLPALEATDDQTVASYKIATLPLANQGTLYLGDPTAGGTLVTAGQVFTSSTDIENLYFKPVSGYTGNATFTYQATDDQKNLSNIATVTIPVIAAATNGPPVPQDKTADPVANNSVAQLPSLVATDDGTVVTYTVTPPATSQGTLYLGNPTQGGQAITAPKLLSPDQVATLFFQPNASFTGNATFTFKATDEKGLLSVTSATVTIPVTAPAPVANNDTATTTSDKPVTIPLFANDQNTTSNTLVTIASPPSSGSVKINPDGSVTYTPNPDFTGTDTFVYQACDAQGQQCTTANVTVTVTAPATPPVTPPTPPVANDDTDTTMLEKPVTIPILTNDTDVQSGTVTITTPPSHGNVTVNPDNTVTYTPATGFIGADNFNYQICNPQGQCATATVTVTVSPPPVTPPTNNPLTLNDDAATITAPNQPVTLPVLSNDQNADPKSVSIATPPAHGNALVNPDGSITYTPNADFTGTDTLIYQACDSQQQCAIALVTITVPAPTSITPPVLPPPSAPPANDDMAMTTVDKPVTIPVLDNDLNVTPGTVTITTPPTQGTVTVNPDNTVTYTPNSGFTGADTFNYLVCNAQQQCDPATVTVNVSAPPAETAAPTTPLLPPTLFVTFGGNGSGSVVSAPTGIDCTNSTPDCKHTYGVNSSLRQAQGTAQGVSVALTPTPTSGSEWVGWGGDSDCTDGNVFMITDDRHCIAYFNLTTQPKFKLTIDKTGEGSITSQPLGINCGASGSTCQKDLPSNVLVNLTAVPQPGYTFKDWAGDCSGNASTVAVTMNQAKSCVANFDKLPVLSPDVHHLTVTKIGSGNGTVASSVPGIDCGGTCNNAYPHNTQVTLTATPDADSNFVGWTGDCLGIAATLTVTINKDKSCIAVFDVIKTTQPLLKDGEETLTIQNQTPFKATITSDPGGVEISPKSSQGAKSTAHYPVGTEVNLTATPEPGVKFTGWGGDADCLDGKITVTKSIACYPQFEKLNTGIVQFGSPTYSAGEPGKAQINVSRKGGCEGKISVDYATQSNTATQPTDYSSTSGTLTWADGDCNDKTIAVPINQVNGDKSLDVRLSNVTGGATLGPTDKAVLTIKSSSSTATSTATTATGTGSCYNLAPCQMCCNSCQAQGSSGDDSEVQFKTLIATLNVGETLSITLADAKGDLLLKELPDNTIVSLDSWLPVGKGAGTLTLTGKKVGSTNMLLVDSAAPAKMATVHINVNNTENANPANNAGLEASAGKDAGLEASAGRSTFGVQSILTTLKVGQTVSVTVAGGKGQLTISEIPNSAFVSLDAWTPLGETGTGEITMTGRSIGNTKAVITDQTNPPLRTVINIKVIKDEDSVTVGSPSATGGTNPSTPAKASSPLNDGGGLEASTGSALGDKPIIGGDSAIDKTACEKNAWGINTDGSPIESKACFIGKVSIHNTRQPNHRMFSHPEAQTIKVAATIIIAPEHVGQVADILMVGVRTTLTDETRYTRDGLNWTRWDDQLSHLQVAEHHYQLPAILEVPIYEGDLSFLPGEYTGFVGYRLQDGTIIYNGADPIHFYIGNAARLDLRKDSAKASSPASYQGGGTDSPLYQGGAGGGTDYQTATYFEPFTHNEKTGPAVKVGNGLTFTQEEAINARTFVRVDTKDVGQAADILMVATYFPEPAGSDTISYYRTVFVWQQWFGDVNLLPPVQHYHQLPATLEIPIDLGFVANWPGQYRVWVGYRLNNGVIIFNDLDPVRWTMRKTTN
jgi:hypothetical protein